MGAARTDRMGKNQGGQTMSRIHLAAAAFTLIAAALTAPAQAQAPTPPPFATTKIEGTDGVYLFRFGGAQAMFIVTPDGVIATDPIGYLRPQAVQTYIAEPQRKHGKRDREAGDGGMGHAVQFNGAQKRALLSPPSFAIHPRAAAASQALHGSS